MRTVAWLCLLAGCTPPAGDDPSEPGTPSDPTVPSSPSEPTVPTVPAEPSAGDDAFRIDPSTIDVTLEVVPDESAVGHAEIAFTMRPGQVRPLFHFDPDLRQGTARDTLVAVTLDGEPLDPADNADVRPISFDSSPEVGFELRRDLDPAVAHTLTVDWSIPGGILGAYRGWIHTTVDDTAGRGNEVLWPTINAPDAQARHRIELRIDDPREYVAIGSGTVTSRDDGRIRVVELDTEREISSYTVMLAAIPADEVRVETFDAGPVPVTLVSTERPELVARAVDRTRETLDALRADFGPFPMPSLAILMIDWPTGMEYYGATTTGFSSLSHELVHLYWGCSAVNRTWRDTWMDEAINVWWESRDQLPDPPDDLATDIVGGRTEIEPGFDLRAYGVGAVIVGGMADAMGGDDAMVAFLADLHQRRAFAPFTTDDLVEDLVLATGDASLRDTVARWLETPERGSRQRTTEL